MGLRSITLHFNWMCAEKHLVIKAAILNKRAYFKNILTSKFKSIDMLLWRKGFAFVPTGNERLWVHSVLRKIWFD